MEATTTVAKTKCEKNNLGLAVIKDQGVRSMISIPLPSW